MILAIDVDYKDSKACTAGVAFDTWTDEVSMSVHSCIVKGINDYVPGEFYKRELPCILKLLEVHRLEPECIVVDGFVYLDGRTKAGLGRHLYDELGGETSVVGVAKRSFKDISDVFEVYRGQSSKPLFVTSVGMDTEEAKKHIFSMHGQYRIPFLLKQADQLCRSWKC